MEPKTEVFERPNTRRFPPFTLRLLSDVLLVSALLAAVLCALLWIWLGDYRWAGTGFVLCVGLFGASAFVARCWSLAERTV